MVCAGEARQGQRGGDARAALQLEDYDLDRDPGLVHGWLAVLLGLQMLGVFLLLPPLVAMGYLVNLPTAGLLVLAARLGAKKKKDAATVKLLLGTIAYPATWIGAGIAAGLAHHQLQLAFGSLPDTPALAGVTIAVLGAVGGAAALRYWRLARETARAVRVRLTRRRYALSVARLRRERSRLYDAIMAMSEGVELPGDVAPDGRIVAR
jgi:hypothetical protein